VGVVLLSASLTATAQQEKISLCHFTDTYDFGMGTIAIGTELAIPEPAAAAHQEHGDMLTYVLRTMDAGETVCVPDRDGDRSADDEDAFPDDPNREFDYDHDGVEDSDDGCPSEPGPIENQGCPAEDNDGDGVPDHEDECRTVAGTAENAGCPADDSDRDGLVGDADGCPTVWGLPENGGCPNDADGDGVEDAADFCENTPDLSPYVNAATYVDGNGCVYIVGENLSNVNLGEFGDLHGATFIDTNMENIYAVNFNFTTSTWTNVNARGAILTNADFSSGASLENTDLSNADLSGSNMFAVQIYGNTVAVNANFSNVTMSRARISNADFSGANFTGARLQQADLWSVNLTGANLAGANLQGADFTNANLTGANLTGANLTDVIWSNTTCPDGTLSDNNGGFCTP